MTTAASTRTRTLPARDARGRFVAASALATTHVRTVPARCEGKRVRVLPARDARGRFVSFQTTSAPSWYVFAADGYRIPGEAEMAPMRADTAPAPQPLPAAKVVRRQRPGMHSETMFWLGFLVFLVGMAWYALSLPIPHH